MNRTGKFASAALLVILIFCVWIISAKIPDKKEIRIGYTISTESEHLSEKLKPIEEYITNKLKVNTKFVIFTGFNSSEEALNSNKIDLAYLPVTNYVNSIDKESYHMLLQARRLSMDEKTYKDIDKETNSYQSYIWALRDSLINDVKDLIGKKIATLNSDSSAGWIWPAKILIDNKIDIKKDINRQTFGSYLPEFTALLSGQVSAVFAPLNIPPLLQKSYPDVLKQIKIIATSDKIPNDGLAISNTVNAEQEKKIKSAFLDAINSKELHDIFRSVIYNHNSYGEPKLEDYNKAQEIIKEVNK